MLGARRGLGGLAATSMRSRVFRRGPTSFKRSSSNFNIRKNIESSLIGSTLLNEDHYTFLDEERALLSTLQKVLRLGGAKKEDLDLVADLRSRIDDLFMVCVVGEFNAGKSTFINALLGDTYLKSSVLPTTDRICLLRGVNTSSGSDNFVKDAGSADSMVWKKADNFLLDDVEELEVQSAEWLQPGVALVDTPGTNALMSRHEYLSQVIVPRADLILFVTSVERPMSESEVSFLSKIAKWGKKIVLVINKADLVTPEELKSIEEYVRVNAASRLQYTDGKIPVFSLSASKALKSKLAAKGEHETGEDAANAQDMYESSGIKQLETFLASTLGREEVVANKLNTPLLVADRLIAGALERVTHTEEALLSAERTLEMVTENMESFEADLRRDVGYLREKAGSTFQQNKGRLRAFVDQEFRLRNYRKFFNSSSTSSDGEQNERVKEGNAPAPTSAPAQALHMELRHLTALHSLQQPLLEAVGDVASLITQRAKSQAASVVQYVNADRYSTLSSSSSGSNNSEYNAGAAVDGADAEVGRVAEVPSVRWEASRLELITRLSRESKNLLELNSYDQDAEWAVNQAKTRFYALFALSTITNAAFLTAAVAFSNHDLVPGGMVTAYGGLGLGFLTALPIVTSDSMVLANLRAAVKGRFESRSATAQAEFDEAILSAFDHELRHSRELIRGSIAPFERWVKHTRKKTDKAREDLQSIRQETRRLTAVLGKGGSQ